MESKKVLILLAVFMLILWPRQVVAMNLLKAEKTVLPNGVTVVTREVHKNPLVVVDIWVKTGGVYEEDDKIGIAHFIEHMLFKGTERRKPGSIEYEIKSVGGYQNAATSYDYTHYYTVLPSDYLDTALDVETDMLLNPAFDAEELEKERNVIQEEISLGKDDPVKHAWELFYKEAYKDTNYRRPLIGTRESIDKVSRQDFLDFFHKYYTPDNIVVVVVGDFKTSDVLEKIKKIFSHSPAKKNGIIDLPVEGQRKGKIVKEEKRQVEQTYMLIGFPTIPANHPDDEKLQVLSTILGKGRTSRLYQELVEKNTLATSINVFHDINKYGGQFVIMATMEPSHKEKVEEKILKVLENVRNEGITNKELAKAKNMIESGFIFSNEKIDSQATALGSAEIIGGIEMLDKYIAKIRVIGKEDVKDVARKYLTLDTYTKVVIYPDEG